MKKSGILGTITWLYGILVIILAILSFVAGKVALSESIANILKIVTMFGSIPFIIIGIIAIIIDSNRNRAINGLIFIGIAYLIPIVVGLFK